MRRGAGAWALAQHRTSFSQPGHIRQRAVVPRWPEEPLAQLSWASSPWHRWRSRTHLRPGMWSPVSSSTFTSIAWQRGACLPDERFLNGEGQGTTRLWSQMHGRLRRRCRAEEDRCPVFASRAASADRYDSTCYSVTWCETGHSCCRAAHWHTACVCSVRAVCVHERVTSLLRRACSHRGCSRAAARKQEAPPNLG